MVKGGFDSVQVWEYGLVVKFCKKGPALIHGQLQLLLQITFPHRSYKYIVYIFFYLVYIYNMIISIMFIIYFKYTYLYIYIYYML